jgi:hypothetical protein
MEDGNISLVMGLRDIKTSFKIDVEFKDARCMEIFQPTMLKVNLEIVLTCGTENEMIEVRDEEPYFILEQVKPSQFYSILSSQDFFKFTSANSQCGIKSIGLFSDKEGINEVGES